MKQIGNQGIIRQEVIIYTITGKKAKYEFLIEQMTNGTYRAYLLRMWGDADTSSSRKETRYTNDGDDHNFYVTRSPTPRTLEEARDAALQWVTEVDQRWNRQNSSPPPSQSKMQAPWNDARTNERGPQVLKMTQEVWNQIEKSIGSKHAETGGALGGSREEFLVEHFYFDRSSSRSGVTYSPDDVSINRMFREDWNPRGINLLGFVHSHPANIWRPSGGDLVYARKILQAIPDLEYLLLPIVQSKANTGRFDIHPYAAIRGWNDIEIKPLKLVIVPAASPHVVELDTLSSTRADTHGDTSETSNETQTDTHDTVDEGNENNPHVNEEPDEDYVNK